jgi:hypothetical protein
MATLRKMAASSRSIVYLGVSLLLLSSLAGCAGLWGGKSAKEPAEPNMGPTVGSVADVLWLQSVPVEGYGLVAGLAGTGSSICPMSVRNYLKQYILAQLSGENTDLDELINSPNTAVVRLEATIPVMAGKGDRFDVRVTPVAGSDTTSFRGGRLFLAELKPPGTFGLDARMLATVEGPVFVDFHRSGEPDLKTGYVLGGGKVSFDSSGRLHLRQANFRVASVIRNRLNERFGPETATALTGGDVGFVVPSEYALRKDRFAKVLTATYLVATADAMTPRIEAALKGLAEKTDKEAREMTLEALGRNATAGLASLLQSPNEEVRLRAARCMLFLHDDRGLPVLNTIVSDLKSSRRVEALEAIAAGARVNDAATLLRPLLADDDEQIVRAAFEHLRRMRDASIREEVVNGDFYLDTVPDAKNRAILVFRSGEPRIVLLGQALSCRSAVSVESPDSSVTVAQGPGGDSLVISRKSATRGARSLSIRSGLSVSEVIRALGGPVQSPRGQTAGLSVSYAEITCLLQRMCEAKAIDAQFWLGPLTKFESSVKK